MNLTFTIFLILITVGVSFYAYDNRQWMDRLIFSPYAIKQNKKEWYRIITHAFIHADIFHLLFNMMVMYSFGEAMEYYFKFTFGSKGLYYYCLLYFGGVAFAVLPSMVKHSNNPFYASLGASGGTSALLFAFIALRPFEEGPRFMFFSVPMPSIVFGILFLVIEYLLMKRGGTNVAHNAHIFGALFGFCFTLLIDLDNFNAFIIQLQMLFRS